jgi:phospholipase/carboxylesterase
MTSPLLLESVVLEPTRPADAAVIWLHGLGASGFDFPPIVPELGLPTDHGIRFVFPHAPKIPVTVNGGMVMPAWYDILAMDFDRKVDEPGVRGSAEHLARLIGREQERGIPPERVVLAGFSQGGAIALHQALRHPDKLAGLVLLSTYIAADCDLENERAPANSEIPIFQAHGTQDPMVTHPMGMAARERLGALGYQVKWHEYPMEHQVVAEEITALGTWLRDVLGNTPE